MAAGKRTAKVHIYRSYRFLNKDPVIDKCRTLIQDEGLKENHAALISDLSPTTIHNWFHGDTRRPQFSSIAALTRSLGYEIDFKKSAKKTLDVEEELKAAREWREQMKSRGSAALRRVNGEFKFK